MLNSQAGNGDGEIEQNAAANGPPGEPGPSGLPAPVPGPSGSKWRFRRILQVREIY